MSAALVDGTGEAVCVSTDNGILGGVDTACGTKVDISSSLLSVFRSELGSFQVLLGDRPPAFTLLGELRTHRALFRCERWIKLFPQKRRFFNIRLRILDGGR